MNKIRDAAEKYAGIHMHKVGTVGREAAYGKYHGFEAGAKWMAEEAAKVAEQYAHKVLCAPGKCEEWVSPCDSVYEIRALADSK